MKKAVIYARSSVGLNDLSLSRLSAQLNACKEYAEKNSIQIIGIYADTELIGAKRNRTAWNSLVKRKKPNFNYIIVYEYSRIGRSVSKQTKQLKKLKEHGVRVISTFEDFSEESFKQKDELEKILGYCDYYYQEILQNRRELK